MKQFLVMILLGSSSFGQPPPPDSLLTPLYPATEEETLPPPSDDDPLEVQIAQCDGWVRAALAADGDASKGLDNDEFYSFLNDISAPYHDGVAADGVTKLGYFAECCPEYSSLPWVFRIVHKTLSCRCQSLGAPDGCCEGDDAEVLLNGFDQPEPDRQAVEREYRNDFCQQIRYALANSVTRRPTQPPTTLPTLSPTISPSNNPSQSPTPPKPTTSPILLPTTSPTDSAVPTPVPTPAPTAGPNDSPANLPTTAPMAIPTQATTDPASSPIFTFPTTGPTLPPPVPSTEPPPPPPPPLISILIVGSAFSYAPGAINPSGGGEGTTNYVAEQIQTNTNNNSILQHFIDAFAELSLGIAAELPRPPFPDDDRPAPPPLQGNFDEIATIQSVLVSDIECPDGLIYAPPLSPCLQFTTELIPLPEGPLNREAVPLYISNMETATNNEGMLYDKLILLHPSTLIVGLGNPGNGIPYEPPEPETFSEPSSEEPENDNGGGGGGGIGTGGIIAIIIIAFAVLLVLLAMYIYKRKQDENRRLAEFAGNAAAETDLEVGGGGTSFKHIQAQEPLVVDAPIIEATPILDDTKEDKLEIYEDDAEQALDDIPIHNNNNDDDDDNHSQSAASSVWSESENGDSTIKGSIVEEEEEQKMTVGSTLAAMGVASTVATRLTSSNTDPYSPSGSIMAGSMTFPDDDDDQTQISIDSRTESQPNPTRTRNMNDIRAEVASLVERATPGKSVDEFMSEYEGREEELITHLRRILDQSLDIRSGAATTAAANAGATTTGGTDSAEEMKIEEGTGDGTNSGTFS